MNIKIEDKIKRIRDIFGPIKERDSRSVPFIYLIRLFNVIKKHLKGAIGEETALRMLSVTEKIEKMIGTLFKKIKINEIRNVSYAQVAR